MNSEIKRILVLGATGRHGGTGAFVVRALRASGFQVRALVRTIDARTAPLEAAGAEVVIGNLLDRRSLLAPLKDIDVAYFTYPVADGIIEAAANFSSAARSTGLKRVVVMSMATSNPESPSHLGRAQWLAEDLLETSGISCLHLRIAALFFENIELLHRSDILNEGVIRNSFSNIKVSWMSGEDAGKLAVSALLHPGRYSGKTAIYPSGGERFSHSEIAEVLARHLGRAIRHETISAEAWQNRLLAIGSQDSRINAGMAGH
ncbi:MAG TPA: NmrA family NAD(P)-binding protein, partial [Fibrobacteria bacterium]|nr:NmrA family NAD(P)-binding protein [Fibrobacteria bacterium]